MSIYSNTRVATPYRYTHALLGCTEARARVEAKPSSACELRKTTSRVSYIVVRVKLKQDDFGFAVCETFSDPSVT